MEADGAGVDARADAVALGFAARALELVAAALTALRAHPAIASAAQRTNVARRGCRQGTLETSSVLSRSTGIQASSGTLGRMAAREFVPLRVAVLTVSDTRTLATDTSGGAIVSALEGAGHVVAERRIVTDDLAKLRATFAGWVGEGSAVDVVIATGGTGLTGRDVSPEALAPLVTKPIPGFGELFRYLSYADIGTSTIQSRAEGAVCRTTLVFLLPGSTGAVNLAMSKILLPQLDGRTRPCNFVELIPRFAE